MSVLKWLDLNAEKALASILLAAIVLLIFGNVFMRYVMNASLSWGEELTLWLFVWFVWLGVSYAFHTGNHGRKAQTYANRHTKKQKTKECQKKRCCKHVCALKTLYLRSGAGFALSVG